MRGLALGFALGSLAWLPRAAPAATLHGRVRFAESPAPLPRIPRSGGEWCGRPVANPALRVGPEGGLEGVVVEVLSGAGVGGAGAPGATPSLPPAPAVLDQRAGTFVPHVVLLAPGQPLEVRNHDPVLHNVHAVSVRGSYDVFNLGLPPGGQARRVTPVRSGALRVRCDAGHRWMQAYVYVAAGPHHALSDEAGRFRVEGLSPGRHRLRVWHELLGAARLEVDVGPEDTSLELRADLDAAAAFSRAPGPPAGPPRPRP